MFSGRNTKLSTLPGLRYICPCVRRYSQTQSKGMLVSHKERHFHEVEQLLGSMLTQFFSSPSNVKILPHPNVDDSTTGPVIASSFPLATKQQVNYEFNQDTDQYLPSILLRPLAFLVGEG